MWSPEMERTYPFRNYVRDVLLWSMLTDLLPHQQAAAMVLRLKGAAGSLSGRTFFFLAIGQNEWARRRLGAAIPTVQGQGVTSFELLKALWMLLAYRQAHNSQLERSFEPGVALWPQRAHVHLALCLLLFSSHR